MSLELPRLSPFTLFEETLPGLVRAIKAWMERFQIDWQKTVEAIEEHELVQEGILTNLSTTQGELTVAQTELAAAQAALTQTQADLSAAVDQLTTTTTTASTAATDAAQALLDSAAALTSATDANNAVASKLDKNNPSPTGTFTLPASTYHMASDGTFRLNYVSGGSTIFRSGTDSGAMFAWHNAANSIVYAQILTTGFNVDTGLGYRVGNVQVVGPQGAAVADAAGGATIDTQARTAINTLLARLRTHGLILP